MLKFHPTKWHCKSNRNHILLFHGQILRALHPPGIQLTRRQIIDAAMPHIWEERKRSNPNRGGASTEDLRLRCGDHITKLTTEGILTRDLQTRRYTLTKKGETFLAQLEEQTL